MIDWLSVFAATVLVDVAYVYYTRRTAQGRALPAALAAGVIFLAAAYVVRAYVGDGWLVLAAGAGSVVGTYGAVRWDSRPYQKTSLSAHKTVQ